MFQRTMIITPHFDDETIGCGGLISSIAQDSHKELKIVVVSTSNIHNYTAGRVVLDKERETECLQALRELGILHPQNTLIRLSGFEDGKLDQCDRKELVTQLDTIIKEFKPTAVLFPYSSHHQDHQYVYQASISALRPTVDTSFILLKAAYEYPYITTSWNSTMRTDSRIYYPLTEEQINMKAKALQQYRSQLLRDKRDILSVESIINLARVRGTEIGREWAEVFYPVSIILQ